MKNINKKILLVLVLIIIIIIGLIIIIKKKPKAPSELIGTWSLDGVTNYEFKDNYTGSLILPLSKYDFKYTIKDDKIFIDFENEKSKDSEYTFSFEEGKLVLKGSTGKFVFEKK